MEDEKVILSVPADTFEHQATLKSMIQEMSCETMEKARSWI
jgi:hypothetical protein